MCLGGKPKMPAQQAAPTPPPAPQVLPSEVSAQSQEQSRRKSIERMRLGLYSTIKTKPTVDLTGTGGMGTDGTNKKVLG